MGATTVSVDTAEPSEFSPRQNAVLEQALRLLVDGGEKALTTSGVARAANCSKESLYKWFGDRDGLLSAMIAYQASKVRTFERNGERLTAASLHDHVVIFARDLLEVLAGDVSLALNRWRSASRTATARSSASCCSSAAAARSTGAPWR